MQNNTHQGQAGRSAYLRNQRPGIIRASVRWGTLDRKVLARRETGKSAGEPGVTTLPRRGSRGLSPSCRHALCDCR